MADSAKKIASQTFSVTKQQAHFLKIVWELNKNKNIEATYELIKDRWDKELGENEKSVTLDTLRSCVSDILNTSNNLLEKYSIFTTKDKKIISITAFLLHSSAIHLPKTARIFLEFINFEPANINEIYIIPKNQFIEFIERKYNWTKDFIESRIDLGVSSGYLRNETKQDIWINIRLKRELEYVKLISDSLTDSPPL